MPLIEEYLKKFIIPNADFGEIKDHSIAYKTITCGAATSTFSIDPLGDVFPCQSFHFTDFYLGNILHQDFEEIYNSPVAGMLRFSNDVNHAEKCKECNVKYVCGGGCIANTYSIEKGLFKHPETMCPYYRIGAINRLKRIEYQ